MIEILSYGQKLPTHSLEAVWVKEIKSIKFDDVVSPQFVLFTYLNNQIKCSIVFSPITYLKMTVKVTVSPKKSLQGCQIG